MGLLNMLTKAVVIAAAFDWILGGLFRGALDESFRYGSMLSLALQWAVAGATAWQLVQFIGVIAERAAGAEN